MSANKFKQGLVLGKFLPPHRGHQFLIETALAQCERLTVLVCSLHREPIAGALRYGWLREMCPTANVVHVTDENPAYPHEHPDFWQIWTSTVRRHTAAPLDAVFTSEDYGDELAQRLGAKHVLVDLDRRKFPVSGTAVRANPLQHWDFLPNAVRPYFVARVALIGPESTGKTTLAQQLAAHFATVWQPEYGREYVDAKGKGLNFTLKDIAAIAAGQTAGVAAQSRKANRVLFCDTDLLITKCWTEHFFGTCPAWLDDAAQAEKYDLTLLLTPDVAWIADPQRIGPEFSAAFYAKLHDNLLSYGRNFVTISGNYEIRRQRAITAVTEQLNI